MSKLNQEDIENNYVAELTNDDFIDYNGIKIYPAKVKDYIPFNTFVNVLLIEKNAIPDPKIISMSYLEFILTMGSLSEEYEFCTIYLANILTMCLKVDIEKIKYKRNSKNKFELNIDYEGEIKTINYKDFDNIKNIICVQNGIDLPNNNIDPKLKQKLDEALAFKSKNSAKMGNIEIQQIIIMTKTGLKLSDIKELTLRKFIKTLQILDRNMYYEIYTKAYLQDKEIKDKIPHWMEELHYDKYKELMVNYGEFTEKLGSSVKK